MPIEEVFETLSCNRQGLSTEAAELRLKICGYNKLEEKKVFIITSSSFFRGDFPVNIGKFFIFEEFFDN